MTDSVIFAFLIFVGLCLGSFAGATVWRLRARQLNEDRQEGEDVDKQEFARLQPLLHKKPTDDRSRCLHCHHVLRWYDLLPIVSWLSLGGRCRYCRTFIGWYEPIIEVATAALFAVSYMVWNFSGAGVLPEIQFLLWLVSVVLLVILFVYDLKWFLLPNKIMWPFIVVAAVFALLTCLQATDLVAALLSLAGAVAILSGVYFVLHYISKGQWIGFGDVKLGLGLALLLGDWKLAFAALFLANVLALLAVLPGMIRGKLTRTSRVPFGPFLILGAVIVFFAGTTLLNWYQLLFLSSLL